MTAAGVKAYRKANTRQQKQRILKQLNELQGPRVVDTIPEAQKTGAQVFGEGGVTALSALMGGMSSGQLAPGAGMAAKTGIDAGIGGLFGLSRAVSEGLEGEELVKPTLTSAAFAGGISLLGQSIDKMLKGAPERMLKSERFQTPAQQRSSPDAWKELLRELDDSGLTLSGSLDDQFAVVERFGKKFDKASKLIANNLDDAGRYKITIEDVAEALGPVREKWAANAAVDKLSVWPSPAVSWGYEVKRRNIVPREPAPSDRAAPRPAWPRGSRSATSG